MYIYAYIHVITVSLRDSRDEVVSRSRSRNVRISRRARAITTSSHAHTRAHTHAHTHTIQYTVHATHTSPNTYHTYTVRCTLTDV